MAVKCKFAGASGLALVLACIATNTSAFAEERGAAAGSIKWDITDRELHVGAPVTVTVEDARLDSGNIRVLIDEEFVGTLAQLGEVVAEQDGPASTRCHVILWLRSRPSENAAVKCAGVHPILAAAGAKSFRLEGGGLEDKSLRLQVVKLPPTAEQAIEVLYPCVDLDSFREMSSEEREHASRGFMVMGRMLYQQSEETTAEAALPSEAERAILANHPDWNELLPTLLLCYEARLTLRKYNRAISKSDYRKFENEHLRELRTLKSKIEAVQPSNPFALAVRDQILRRIENSLNVAAVMKSEED